MLQTKAFIFRQIKVVFCLYLTDNLHSTVCVSGCVTAGNPLLLVEPVPQKVLTHRNTGFCYLLNPVGHDPTLSKTSILGFRYQPSFLDFLYTNGKLLYRTCFFSIFVEFYDIFCIFELLQLFCGIDSPPPPKRTERFQLLIFSISVLHK